MAKKTIVAGVDISKVDRSALEVAYKVAFDRDAAALTPRLVEELAAHYQATAGAEIMECDKCGGGSPPTLDSCPFCGEGEGDGDTLNREKVVVPEPPASAVIFAVNGNDPREDDAKRTKRKGVAPPKAAPAPSTPAVSLVIAPRTELVTVADLDRSLGRVRVARDAGASALWDLSMELRAIHDGNLWRLRNDEKGAPKYKNFAKFIAEEVDLHERTVWRMIEVTREFKPEQAQKYGVSILRGLLGAPKEDRAGVLADIDSGKVTGKRGVEREVAAIRGRKGVTVLGKAGNAKAASEAAAKAAAAKRLVTAALPAGRTTVPLFARAAAKGDAERRAKAAADKPWGKLECSNGVTIYVALTENGDGDLELTLEARRDE